MRLEDESEFKFMNAVGGTGHRDDGWNLALDKLFKESKCTR